MVLLIGNLLALFMDTWVEDGYLCLHVVTMPLEKHFQMCVNMLGLKLKMRTEHLLKNSDSKPSEQLVWYMFQPRLLLVSCNVSLVAKENVYNKAYNSYQNYSGAGYVQHHYLNQHVDICILPKFGSTFTSRTVASPFLTFGHITFTCSVPSAFFLTSRNRLRLKYKAAKMCLSREKSAENNF